MELLLWCHTYWPCCEVIAVYWRRVWLCIIFSIVYIKTLTTLHFFLASYFFNLSTISQCTKNKVFEFKLVRYIINLSIESAYKIKYYDHHNALPASSFISTRYTGFPQIRYLRTSSFIKSFILLSSPSPAFPITLTQLLGADSITQSAYPLTVTFTHITSIVSWFITIPS